MTDSNSRVQRVADQIQRDLATLIQTEVDDPRIGMVSITGVEVSRDLAYAKVFVTVMNSLSDDGDVNESTLKEPGDLDRKEVEDNIKALNQASGYLRTLLAKRLQLRSVPKLKFFFDSSLERGQRLSSLIDEALQADRKQQQDS